jgi:hypothetical protein
MGHMSECKAAEGKCADGLRLRCRLSVGPVMGNVRLHSDKRRKILIGAGKVRHANITQDGLSATA